MLTDAQARKALPGERDYKLTDEKGLFLLVRPGGGKLWRYKYRFAGREKLLSFGPYPEVKLSEARDLRDDARRLIRSGVDPSAERKRVARTARSDSANGSGNGGGNVSVTPTPTPAPTASPTPTPTPSPTSRNVSACLNQVIPGTGGATPASLVLPDTVKLNFGAASGFPNGRLLADPVIDVTLAVLLLDLSRHSPATFATIPLNPPHDSQLLSAFPFLGLANGGQPSPGTGTAFNFRSDPFTSYVRVDRMGQPAVATALIGSPTKNAYNDANPSDDVAQTFVPEIVSELTKLHNALADDLIALGLRPCST